MNILHELYHGRISPFERESPDTIEYHELTKQISAAEDALAANLSVDKRQQYDICTSLIFRRQALIEEEIFIDAFKMGARMMLAVLGGEE